MMIPADSDVVFVVFRESTRYTFTIGGEMINFSRDHGLALHQRLDSRSTLPTAAIVTPSEMPGQSANLV